MVRISDELNALGDSAIVLACTRMHGAATAEHLLHALLQGTTHARHFNDVVVSMAHARDRVQKTLAALPASGTPYRGATPVHPDDLDAPPEQFDTHELDALFRAAHAHRSLLKRLYPPTVADVFAVWKRTGYLDDVRFDVAPFARFVQRARSTAAAMGAEPRAEHALIAAVDDPEIAAPLAAAGFDPAVVRAQVGAQAAVIGTEVPVEAPEWLGAMAVARANNAGARELSIRALVGVQLRNGRVTSWLSDAGLSAIELHYAVFHGRKADQESAVIEGPVAIALFNDDSSTMEFVAHTLSTVLELDEKQARAVMFAVHEHGQAQVPQPSFAAAREAYLAIRRLARDEAFPLRVEVVSA